MSILEQFALNIGRGPTPTDRLTGGLQQGAQLADIFAPPEVPVQEEVPVDPVAEAKAQADLLTNYNKTLEVTRKLYGGAKAQQKGVELGIFPKESRYVKVKKYGLDWDAVEIPGEEEPVILDKKRYNEMSLYAEKQDLLGERQKSVAKTEAELRMEANKEKADLKQTKKPARGKSPSVTGVERKVATRRFMTFVKDSRDIDPKAVTGLSTASGIIASAAKSMDAELGPDSPGYDILLARIEDKLAERPDLLVPKDDGFFGFGATYRVNEDSLVDAIQELKNDAVEATTEPSRFAVYKTKDGKRSAQFEVFPDGTRKFIKYLN